MCWTRETGVIPAALAGLLASLSLMLSYLVSLSTGLGLWLSRAIVEEEGGTLSWRNRPEGGAVFTVHLPVAHAETRLPQAAAG